MRILKFLKEIYHDFMDNKYVKIMLLIAIFLILVGMAQPEAHSAPSDAPEQFIVPVIPISDDIVYPPQPIRSVNIYSIKPPVIWADERREPTPPRPLPSYRQSSPDWRCDEWMDMARTVGWEEQDLPKLSYVIYRETRCRPDQHNPDDPMGGSNGLMQINQFWCKPTRYWPQGWLQAQNILQHCDELYDAETNLTAGLAIKNNSGWSPWGL